MNKIINFTIIEHYDNEQIYLLLKKLKNYQKYHIVTVNTTNI